MENLATIAILALAAWWLFRYGKQTGSRQAYHAGRHHSRRRQK